MVAVALLAPCLDLWEAIIHSIIYYENLKSNDKFEWLFLHFTF